jgi:hypothetical protein
MLNHPPKDRMMRRTDIKSRLAVRPLAGNAPADFVLGHDDADAPFRRIQRTTAPALNVELTPEQFSPSQSGDF